MHRFHVQKQNEEKVISYLLKLINIVEVFMGEGGVGGHFCLHLPAPQPQMCGDGAWGSEIFKYVK